MALNQTKRRIVALATSWNEISVLLFYLPNYFGSLQYFILFQLICIIVIYSCAQNDLVNMIKGGCENKSVLFIPFDLLFKKCTKIEPFIGE